MSSEARHVFMLSGHCFFASLVRVGFCFWLSVEFSVLLDHCEAVPASAAGHGRECFRYCTLTLLSRILLLVYCFCLGRLRLTLLVGVLSAAFILQVWLVCFSVVLLRSSRRALFRDAWRPFFRVATLLDCCVKPKGARPTFKGRTLRKTGGFLA